MESNANIVIVGAGIVGCSLAYHLTQLGCKDIVVLEQGPLYETGGSTSHAPGLAYQINPSKTMTEFARYTADLWTELHLNGQPTAKAIGSLEIALTKARLLELKRRHGYAMSWGIEAHLISSKEACEKVPMLSEKNLGALYVPGDIQTGRPGAIKPAEAMALQAIENGAKFYEHTKVVGFDIKNDKITSVHTDKGNIRTDFVIAAAGIWAPRVGKLAGVPISLSPMQHLYAVTSPLPHLADEIDFIREPFIRHQDRAMYFRQERNSYGIGSYHHAPLPLAPDEILDYKDDFLPPAERPFTPEHFEKALSATREVFPRIGDFDLIRKFNGIFSFTPDGFPILGESPLVKGFWSAQAVWITHSAGVGKAVAEWIVHGESSIDLRECDIRRFHKYATSPNFVKTRASEQYKEVYDIVHPLQQASRARDIKLTPFHERQKELGAVFFESAGWERPHWYERNPSVNDYQQLLGGIRQGWEAMQWSPNILTEHMVTREKVGIFDLTPFAKLEIEGNGSLEFLQNLTSNEMDKPIGSITYTAMLTPSGGIKCDLTITRKENNRFMVITGGAAKLHDLDWMESHLPSGSSIKINDVSEEQFALGLWGPRSRDLLELVCGDDISNSGFPYMTAKPISISGVKVSAIRISYAGELGWEIYGPINKGLQVWDILWESGQKFGLIAVGYGAFESLRLEKGYRLWGNDIHTEYNPYEAGLGFAVKMNKGEFIGRDALQKLKNNGINRKLCCMRTVDSNSVVMGKEPVMIDGRVVSYITSANYSYSNGHGIAYAYLPLEYSKEHTRLDVLYFGEKIPVSVIKEPVYDSGNLKIK